MVVDDTIVAVSSPPGPAMRGIIRLSGPRASALAQHVFKPDLVGPPEAGLMPRRVAGKVTVEAVSLPAAALVFPAPRSYTRQDIVEIHLLGAPTLLGMVTEALLACGARRAEPGEFTARAFLAGAMDLSQVHGIAGMIAAVSDAQLRAAARLLHGSLSETAQKAREEIADLLSLVEGALDFADEPIEFITPVALRDRLVRVKNLLADTSAAGLRTERWGRLPRAVLLGRPNAGKSSLFNSLSGMNRAICAPVPGTTRDVISAPIRAESVECLLLDIAGLDAPRDRIDARAQAQAREAVESADVVLLVIDAAEIATGFDSVGAANSPIAEFLADVQAFLREDQARFIVANKADLVSDAQMASVANLLCASATLPVIETSTITGEGCDHIRSLIARALFDRPMDKGDGAIALMAEHREALDESVNAVDRAIALTVQSSASLADADLVAAELHAAAAALGALVGREDTEELLGRIFSRFCVGK